MIPGVASTPRPTKSELAILRILWERGPLSVRDVHTALSASKPTGYTTALKLMQIMTEKRLLRDFIDRAYGGSVKALVMQALSSRKPSQKDLEELEALLDRVEKED